MGKAAVKNPSSGEGEPDVNIFVTPLPSKISLFGSLIQEFLTRPDIWVALTYVNMLMIYILGLTFVAGKAFSIWHALLYGALVYMMFSLRSAWRERQRRMNAHRIPFFADSLANALAVGGTLEQAFKRSIYYLRGDLKTEFEKVMAKNSLGKDLGGMLRNLEERYPRTGLKYLIALLEEYQDLGIGISPLLKQIADALKVKEEAEEKIRGILAGGSTYARLSIGIFGLTFLIFAGLLRDQIPSLMEPSLKPILMFLVGWACLGIAIVTRITSLDFASHYALTPYIKPFMKKIQWTIPNLLTYSALNLQPKKWERIVSYAPIIAGYIMAIAVSWHSNSLIIIGIGFLLGVMFTRLGIEFLLKGIVEDQLLETLEIFPDFLQVYVIGLNSGLNSYMALRFATRAMDGVAPELLRRELFRTKDSLACGENHAKAWQRLADRLPFETIIDFAEIMIISPLHGESIVKSIVQMMTGYQSKKLYLLEKKADALSQYVVPVIVIAFFPLFLFAVFGPLWLRISALFNK
jgi:Flp pilus assembly protein TadB